MLPGELRDHSCGINAVVLAVRRLDDTLLRGDFGIVELACESGWF